MRFAIAGMIVAFGIIISFMRLPLSGTFGQRWVETTATVIERLPDTSGPLGTPTGHMRISYSFTTPDGNFTGTARTRDSGDNPTVTIQYDPGDPSSSQIKGRGNGGLPFLLLASVLGGLVVLVAAGRGAGSRG